VLERNIDQFGQQLEEISCNYSAKNQVLRASPCGELAVKILQCCIPSNMLGLTDVLSRDHTFHLQEKYILCYKRQKEKKEESKVLNQFHHL